jgi:hypothetical protein
VVVDRSLEVLRHEGEGFRAVLDKDDLLVKVEKASLGKEADGIIGRNGA